MGNQVERQILLETPRLLVFPLERTEHLLLLDDIRSLEKHLRLLPGTDDFPVDFYEAMHWLYNEGEGHSDRYWYSYWQIVMKEGPYGVGGSCFKGCPCEAGEVEIGYGIFEKFRGRGFMQEALGEICAWAFRQPAVRIVKAETDISNVASQRVLSGCGFRKQTAGEEAVMWKRHRPGRI